MKSMHHLGILSAMPQEIGETILNLENLNEYNFGDLTIYEGRYLNLFIDRKIKEGYKHPRMLLVDYKFDDSLYEQETLLGGELIKKKDSLISESFF